MKFSSFAPRFSSMAQHKGICLWGSVQWDTNAEDLQNKIKRQQDRCRYSHSQGDYGSSKLDLSVCVLVLAELLSSHQRLRYALVYDAALQVNTCIPSTIPGGINGSSYITLCHRFCSLCKKKPPNLKWQQNDVIMEPILMKFQYNQSNLNSTLPPSFIKIRSIVTEI